MLYASSSITSFSLPVTFFIISLLVNHLNTLPSTMVHRPRKDTINQAPFNSTAKRKPPVGDAHSRDRRDMNGTVRRSEGAAAKAAAHPPVVSMDISAQRQSLDAGPGLPPNPNAHAQAQAQAHANAHASANKLRVEIFVLALPNDQYQLCPANAQPLVVPLRRWSEPMKATADQPVTLCVVVLADDQPTKQNVQLFDTIPPGSGALPPQANQSPNGLDLMYPYEKQQPNTFQQPPTMPNLPNAPKALLSQTATDFRPEIHLSQRTQVADGLANTRKQKQMVYDQHRNSVPGEDCFKNPVSHTAGNIDNRRYYSQMDLDPSNTHCGHAGEPCQSVGDIYHHDFVTGPERSMGQYYDYPDGPPYGPSYGHPNHSPNLQYKYQQPAENYHSIQKSYRSPDMPIGESYGYDQYRTNGRGSYEMESIV